MATWHGSLRISGKVVSNCLFSECSTSFLGDVAGVPDEEHPVISIALCQVRHIVVQGRGCGLRFDLNESALGHAGKDELQVHSFLRAPDLADTALSAGREDEIDKKVEVLPGEKVQQIHDRYHQRTFGLLGCGNLGGEPIAAFSQEIVSRPNIADRPPEHLHLQQTSR